MTYENMGLKELRTLCSQAAVQHGLAGREKNGITGRQQINFWNKADCISYLYSVQPKHEGQQHEGDNSEGAAASSSQQQAQGNSQQQQVSQSEGEGEGQQDEQQQDDEQDEGEDSEDSSKLVKALIETLDGKLKARTMDAAQIEKLVDKKLAKLSRPMTVTVKRPDDTSYELGACHKQVPELVKLASMRQATFLVGPAGSGKTTACRQAAEALALSFEYTAFSSQSTKTDLYGFIDAHGVYRETSFRRMYENGGFWLGDEMDAAAANILLTLNAAIDNGFASFPDKMVKAHPDFMCFAAGNTYGKGRDRQYVGRNELDAASLDRFWFMAFDYDEAFEASLATDSSWTLEVQSIRKAVFDLGERLVVSPRASIKGSKLIVAGFTREQCRESLIFRGANQELVNRVLSQAGVR